MSYVELRSKINEWREKAKEEAEKFFQEGAKQLFDKFPELESFGWRQYTPYFNDGDVCTFSAGTDEPDINDVMGYDIYGEEYKHLVPLQDEVSKFLNVFENEDLEAMFGDHAEITVTRDDIEVNRYDHE